MSIYCFYFHLFFTELNLKPFLVLNINQFFFSKNIYYIIFFSLNVFTKKNIRNKECTKITLHLMYAVKK